MNLQTSATVKERSLCKQFATSMELIAQGKLEDAKDILVDINLDYGTDGPTRFYLDLLNGNNSPEVQLVERGVVRVDGK